MKIKELTFEDARAAGQRGMTVASENAGADFRDQARGWILSYLRTHGDSSAEDITDNASECGLVPPSGEARAWGAPFNALARQGRIEAAGTARRRKGHGVRGATVWRIKQ
jgi:hypothetical protein